MSSPFLNPQQQEPQVTGWERLIPGEIPALRAGKKRPQSVKSAQSAAERVTDISREEPARSPAHPPGLLVPGPLQTRAAWRWLWSTMADFLLVGLNWLWAGALAAAVSRSFPHARLARTTIAPGSWLGIAILNAALITLLGYSEGLYAEHGDLRRQARILAKSVFWATAVLCLAYGLQGAPLATTGWLCAVGGMNFATLWTWRWSKRQGQTRTSGGAVRNVLIVGAGSVGRRFASYLERHPDGRVTCGFLDNQRPLGDGVIGRVRDLARLARSEFVDEVILAAPHDRRLTLDVLREARRLRLDVEFIPELFGCKPAEAEMERVGDLPLVCLHTERLPAAGLVLKRILDIAASSFTLVILSPLLAVIAALIKLDSPGSVLYRAPRAGRKGRRFLCYKFRTMVRNADALKHDLRHNNERSGPFFKIADDPRITRLGRLLRHYSLDELPQFWNVLRGDMSLVGPRPHPLDDLAAYEIKHLARLDVTPGITGLWQITARRDPSFERAMELDREYIRTWSLGSDLRILLKTVPAVLCGGGD